MPTAEAEVWKIACLRSSVVLVWTGLLPRARSEGGGPPPSTVGQSPQTSVTISATVVAAPADARAMTKVLWAAPAGGAAGLSTAFVLLVTRIWRTVLAVPLTLPLTPMVTRRRPSPVATAVTSTFGRGEHPLVVGAVAVGVTVTVGVAVGVDVAAEPPVWVGVTVAVASGSR